MGESEIKNIKTELKKFNGTHEPLELQVILKKLQVKLDNSDKNLIKSIIGKYSDVKASQLIINTKNKTDNQYADLKKKIKEQVGEVEDEVKKVEVKVEVKVKDEVKVNPQDTYKLVRFDYIRKLIKGEDQKELFLTPLVKSLFTYNKFDIDDKLIKKWNNYVTQERKTLLFGPFGTQWVNDEQVDDDISDKEKQYTKILKKLMAIEFPPQRSDEWFAARKLHITASELGTVLGDCPYEHPFSFYLKKVREEPFEGGKNCYHGKKLENIATSIYEYRMNVKVEEFGMVEHLTHKFLGASPDGIVGKYKLDGKHKTKFVGRMLEIKVPPGRKIETEGPIIGTIIPIYYWQQTQLQMECCNLEECDFWQCNIVEYGDEEDFINDTDDKEPFRSKTTHFEKGVLIQLLPKDKYEEVQKNYTAEKYEKLIYDCTSFIYPPKIEMSPKDCQEWLSKTIEQLETTHPAHILESVKYWKLVNSHCVTVKRDRKWFAEQLPKLVKVWDNVKIFRERKDLAEILFQYYDSIPIKPFTKKQWWIEKENNKMRCELCYKYVEELCDKDKSQKEMDSVTSKIIALTEKNISIKAF